MCRPSNCTTTSYPGSLFGGDHYRLLFQTTHPVMTIARCCCCYSTRTHNLFLLKIHFFFIILIDFLLGVSSEKKELHWCCFALEQTCIFSASMPTKNKPQMQGGNGTPKLPCEIVKGKSKKLRRLYSTNTMWEQRLRPIWE